MKLLRCQKSKKLHRQSHFYCRAIAEGNIACAGERSSECSQGASYFFFPRTFFFPRGFFSPGPPGLSPAALSLARSCLLVLRVGSALNGSSGHGCFGGVVIGDGGVMGGGGTYYGANVGSMVVKAQAPTFEYRALSSARTLG